MYCWGKYAERIKILVQEQKSKTFIGNILFGRELIPYLSIRLFVLHLLHAVLLYIMSVLGVLLSSFQSLQSFSHDLAVMLTIGKRALHLLQPLLEGLRSGIAVIQTE